MYSVRSAYHVQVNRKRRESDEFSGITDEGWKKLWKLNVPGVVKVFVWKAITNSLPIMKNLMKRKVIKEALCPMCKRCDETVCHALWSCSGEVMSGHVKGVQCRSGQAVRRIFSNSGMKGFQSCLKLSWK